MFTAAKTAKNSKTKLDKTYQILKGLFTAVYECLIKIYLQVSLSTQFRLPRK